VSPQPPGDDLADDLDEVEAAGASHEISGRDRSDHERLAANALLRTDEVVAGYVPGVNILNGCDFYST
jgi:branched-chain amino acid transport system ATP-binding protein